MSYSVEKFDVNALALQYNDYTVDLRRYFHRNPEPSMKEEGTAKRIREELDRMGISWFSATETGTVGVIEGDGTCPENILALRADIDALELTELVEWDHKSQIAGMMHGCGHDAHTAMLLGAARILKDKVKGKFPGTIYLLFQPGEESTLGAKYVVETGVLDGIKAIYGQHLWSYYDTGKLLTRGGRMMAGAKMFDIYFTGVGGHGSSLDKCVNPLIPAAVTAMSLQTIVSQNVNAKDIASLCVGQINGGSRNNIVPESAHLGGNFRTFSRETEETVCKRICQIAEHVSAAYDVKAEVTFSRSIPSLHTDPALTKVLEGSLRKVVGEENLVELPIEMGSEDFSEYGVLCPCVYSFVGCRNDEKGCNAGHHSGYFKVDEDSLKYGVAAYVQFVLDYFERDN